MIRRRLNPTGVYAGLSSLVLIAAVPGPVDPQASAAPLRPTAARSVQPESPSGAAADVAAPFGLDPTI